MFQFQFLKLISYFLGWHGLGDDFKQFSLWNKGDDVKLRFSEHVRKSCLPCTNLVYRAQILFIIVNNVYQYGHVFDQPDTLIHQVVGVDGVRSLQGDGMQGPTYSNGKMKVVLPRVSLAHPSMIITF